MFIGALLFRFLTLKSQICGGVQSVAGHFSLYQHSWGQKHREYELPHPEKHS